MQYRWDVCGDRDVIYIYKLCMYVCMSCVRVCVSCILVEQAINHKSCHLDDINAEHKQHCRRRVSTHGHVLVWHIGPRVPTHALCRSYCMW